MSPEMYATLRYINRYTYLALDVWRKLDQRRVRGLWLRGLVFLDRDLDLNISSQGMRYLAEFSAPPKTRRVASAPLFKRRRNALR